MYKTEISDAKWWVYDILGNIGWIAYFIVLGKCFTEKPEFMEYWGMAIVMILAVIPAICMLIGLIELINERINKLDRILPKIRVYRGFGALTLGGFLGAVIALIGIIYGFVVAKDVDVTYLYVMFVGGLLCAVFAGLCFKGYRKIEYNV